MRYVLGLSNVKRIIGIHEFLFVIIMVGGGREGVVVIVVGVPVTVSDVNRMVAVHGHGCLRLPTTAISNAHCVGNIQYQPMSTK